MRRVAALVGIALVLVWGAVPAGADTAPTAATPSAPANYSHLLTNTVTFQWSPATDDLGVSKYELYLNGVRLATLAPSITSYTAANLPDGTSMPWRVVAWDTAGNRTPSVQRYVDINAKPPVLYTEGKVLWEWDRQYQWPYFTYVGLDGSMSAWLVTDPYETRIPTYKYDVAGSYLRLARHWISINDGPWDLLDDPDAPSDYFRTLPGKRYRIRTQIVDYDGRASNVITGTKYVRVQAVQDTSLSVTYSGNWRKVYSTETVKNYGGSHKESSAAGASATLTFTGRAIAWVTNSGPESGLATVYIDGKGAGQVDSRSWEEEGYCCGGWGPRIAVDQWTWPVSGTHTIKIVNQGTSGRPRISLDAFMILK